MSPPNVGTMNTAHIHELRLGIRSMKRSSIIQSIKALTQEQPHCPEALHVYLSSSEILQFLLRCFISIQFPHQSIGPSVILSYNSGGRAAVNAYIPSRTNVQAAESQHTFKSHVLHAILPPMWPHTVQNTFEGFEFCKSVDVHLHYVVVSGNSLWLVSWH